MTQTRQISRRLPAILLIAALLSCLIGSCMASLQGLAASAEQQTDHHQVAAHQDGAQHATCSPEQADCQGQVQSPLSATVSNVAFFPLLWVLSLPLLFGLLPLQHTARSFAFRARRKYLPGFPRLHLTQSVLLD